MMGTVGELPKEPAQPVKFLEDMSDHQIAKAVFLLKIAQNPCRVGEYGQYVLHECNGTMSESH